MTEIPSLAGLLDLWAAYPAYRTFREELLARGRGEASGLSGSLPAFLTAALARDLALPVLVVTAGSQEARRWQAQLEVLLPGRPCFFFPPRPPAWGEVSAESGEWAAMRLAALDAVAGAGSAILVAPVQAARELLLPAGAPALELTAGQEVEPQVVAARLDALGYRTAPAVEAPGQMSRRGGILDVWPPGADPVRIEWWDVVIESLRRFDPVTQTSVERVDRVRVAPAREAVLEGERLEAVRRRIAGELDTARTALLATGRRSQAEALEERYSRVLRELEEGNLAGAAAQRLAAACGPGVVLSRRFREPPLVVYDDWPRIAEAVRGQAALEREEAAARLERGEILPVEAETSLGDPEAWAEALDGRARLYLSLLPHARTQGGAVLALAGRPAPRVHGQPDRFAAEVGRLRKARQRVVLAVRDPEQAQVLGRELLDRGINPRPGLGVPGEVGFLLGLLGEGFWLPELGLVVLAQGEISGREVQPLPAARRRPGGPAVKLTDLKPGDYVVHVTHGIGRFLGLATLEVDGRHKEYLHIAYAGQDTLYVPVEQVGLVQKYVGVEGQEPRLSRMGGGEWARVKERVRRSVRELAEELIRLYARRQTEAGFAFPPDTPWQADFEAAFPYEETPDQLSALRAIKADMEAPRPMDRLLCGDVGYGKTEVALRAAFKAVLAGKQVAFLVPTTLLAEQHYATAKSRLAGYPVTVEALSRLRSPREQRRILEGLASGRVDLVIGTHRLLAKDVRFRDLGLLIVDEEHRFGVAHKERIKALKANVDVLTLSATPIPRTLHMALVGIRDMSVIETPPEDRLPVETMVLPYQDEVVREAIRREVDRGGQVFYVHNRIHAIDRIVARLERLLPGLRIGVVHGQVGEDQMEEVMARFVAHEYDVLVATAIIESGLDIPNANTLIVEDADQLGLAQLYQLRGRVGRSARLAYAFFTYRPERVLTPAAQRRLETIREFTELGSGYQIALRDLEIRGAGNLLGAEQHGHIAAVGFDLYTELLAEAVRELKGEAAPAPVPDPQLDLTVEAYLPEGYIPEVGQKIGWYKRLAQLQTPEEVDQVAAELADRYGPLPPPAHRLLQVARIRTLARALRLAAVSERPDRVVLKATPQSPLQPDALRQLGQVFSGRLLPGRADQAELAIRLSRPARPGEAADVAETALDILKGVWAGALSQG
ncbi:MAG: transcription-repair coupling factor [Firmicutes bacterium]|nr:transcription-repair coupling factor [Bacillota bacterium]